MIFFLIEVSRAEPRDVRVAIWAAIPTPTQDQHLQARTDYELIYPSPFTGRAFASIQIPDGHSHKRKRSNSPRKVAKVALPSRAQPLHKDDYQEYRPLFALYLDVQKSLDFDELTDHEARGRWKSFMKKWYVSHIQSGFQADS